MLNPPVEHGFGEEPAEFEHPTSIREIARHPTSNIHRVTDIATKAAVSSSFSRTTMHDETLTRSIDPESCQRTRLALFLRIRQLGLAYYAAATFRRPGARLLHLLRRNRAGKASQVDKEILKEAGSTHEGLTARNSNAPRPSLWQRKSP